MGKLINMFTTTYVYRLYGNILIVVIMYYSRVIMCYSGVTIRPLN